MTDPLEDKLRELIARNKLPSIDKKILVAVSGGADSMALLLLIQALGYECRGAHCNFGLRGNESERDCEFVIDQFKRLGIPLDVKRFDIDAYRREHRGTSVEMACREVRYEWFEQLRKLYHMDYVAVAHHSDDNIETFILNATRGTGISGLAAMRTINDKRILRPLLSISRKELSDYLSRKGQLFVTDSTNAENIYRRNAIRNIVLPAIEKAIPDAKTGLTTTIKNINDDLSLYNELINHIVSDISFDGGYDLNALMAYSQGATLLYEILRKHGFSKEQCVEMWEIIHRPWHGSKLFISENLTLELRQDLTLNIVAKDDRKEYKLSLEEIDINLPINIKIDHVKYAKFIPSSINGRQRIALSQKASSHKLTLRHWRPGDRMTPFGMNGSRLLSDIYSDCHLSGIEKKSQWVVVDNTTGDILWAVGFRASKHLAVANTDTEYYILSVNLDQKSRKIVN